MKKEISDLDTLSIWRMQSERRQARRRKRGKRKTTVDPHNVGGRSQDTIGRLFRRLGGKAPQVPVMKVGEGRYRSLNVDRDATLGGYQIPMEVKGVSLKCDDDDMLTGNFALSNISNKQRRYLDEAITIKGKYPALAVLWWDVSRYGVEDMGTCDVMHIVPWGAWLDFERYLAGMAEMAMERTRWRGRSIRFHSDEMRRIDDWRIERVAGRWNIDKFALLSRLIDVCPHGLPWGEDACMTF